MKKFLTIAVLLFASLSIIAAPKLQSKKLAQAAGDSAVSIYYAEAADGVIDIIWQADSTLSKAYDIQIGRLDTATYNYDMIADLASYSSNFAVDGFDGYFQISSDLVLQYGDNYSTIGDYGASASTIAVWQAAWEASVNESDYTLKPGFYVIFVEGVDLSFETTEAYDYAIVEVVDSTEAIGWVGAGDKQVKYIDPYTRDLYILRDGKKYNVMGHIVK